MVPGVEGAVVNGGVRVALALARRPDVLQHLGLTLDAAIGDPGMKVHLHNRLASDLVVRSWGVIPRKALPRLSRLPALVRPEQELIDTAALHARSAGVGYASDALKVPSGESIFLWAQDAPHPSGRVAPLCGWVDLAAYGVLISRPKRDRWSRSDIGPVVCDCGHHEVLHDVRSSRLRISMRSWGGPCTVKGCSCRRKRTRKGLTLDSSPNALPLSEADEHP